MKKFATLAAICLTATLVGCSSTQDTVSPAAVSECGVNCESACCEKSCGDDCTKACCASPGAMGDKPADCSGKSSADCSGCPFSGKKDDTM